MKIRILVATISSLLSINTLSAENSVSPESEIERLTVTAKTLHHASTASLKTPTPLINVPQSLSVVSRLQLDEQAFASIGDILRFSPGASMGQGEGHRDQITIRGQNTTADFFIDGLRDDVQYFRPLYNLESVEILRGSNALVFGRGGGGGVINRVTKKAKLGESFHSITAAINSFGQGSISTDNNVALNHSQSLRLNAFYESMDNHRDFNQGDRFAINPTYTKKISEHTNLVVSYEYVEDDRLVDRGIPSLDGQPLKGQQDTYFGDPDFNRTTLEANILKARLDHQVTENWTANLTIQYADFDKFYQNLYPAAFNGDSQQVTLDGYMDATQRENLIAQYNAVGIYTTGKVEHTLLVGAEYGQQDTSNNRRDTLFAQSNDDQISILFSDPLMIPVYDLTDFVRDRSSSVTFSSLYVQDEISLFEDFIFVMGLRYDQFDIDVVDNFEIANDLSALNNGYLSSNDNKLSPRLGLIYKPNDDMSFYASLSRSFLPRSGDQFLSLSLSTAALEAEEFENKEIGLKYDFASSLSLTAAIFEVERENGTTVDPSNAERSILLGTKTQGFELQLAGYMMDDLHINMTYSYLDAQEMGRLVDNEINNRRLGQVPEHMMSLWSRYALSEKFAVALGVTYQAEQYASLSDPNSAVTLPNFTRVDGAVFYQLDEDTKLQLNLENLFDQEYYPAAHNDNNISTGAPFNVRLGVSYQF